jgi:uncharacterized protein YebE (UPF0316 family)
MADLPLVLPLLVFLAELCVVTIGTIRIIFVARGFKLLAPIFGFAEVLIWLFAIGQIMQNLDNSLCFLAFAGGFALGNYVGLVINEKLALGMSAVQIITHKNPAELIRRLTEARFGVTTLQGQGATGKVQVVYTIVKRKEIDKVTALIADFDADAFYAIDEVETVNRGIFPLPGMRRGGLGRLGVILGKVRRPAATACVPDAQERAAA